MRSIKIKLTLIYGALSLAGLLLTLLIFYSATTASIYQGAKARAEVLSNEFEYAVEIMAAENDFFSMQRLVEKSSLLEDVIQIIVIDTQNNVLAHTNYKLIGQPLSFTSPMINESIVQHRKVSQIVEGHVIFVTPLHGQIYTNEYQDVIGTLWVEIDITPTIALTQRLFIIVTLMAVAISLLFFFGYYLTVKSIIIDRLHEVEVGIARHLQGSLPSAIMIKSSFGSEDEINTLAQTYNYLITSLQDSQKKLKTERDFALLVMESLREGLTISNAEQRFEYVNPAYAGLLGLTPDQIIGRSPKDVTHPDDFEKNSEEENLRKSGKSSSYELRLLASDGNEVHVLISSVPRFQDGKFAGSIAVITNISQRARLEQMKSDFINRASHELRTPLTTAILMAELLGTPAEEDKQQFLTTLKQQLNRQRLLLNDILVAGRIENKKFEVFLSPADIMAVIEEAISSVKPQADARKIAIQLKTPEETLPEIRTDRQSLIQVLLNLLSNAIKYSHPHGQIMVSAHQDGESILVEVTDHGMGIPEQDLPHIATRFYRAKNAAQMEIQGTGIGLYIVSEIMQSLGGSLKIDSIENEGTTATIRLPIKPKDDHDALA